MPKPPEQEQRPRSPSPSIDPVLTWPTPGREDLLFFVERNGDLPENKTWKFGDPYRGRGEYPDHKLVYVSPQTPDKWSRWFYASDRINQENYNYEFTGEQLTRSFLVPRDKYFARTAAEAAAAQPTVQDEFTRPVVATADSRFTSFVYAEDNLRRTETELDSLYVVVQQVYVPDLLVSEQWDEVLQRVIKVTRQVIPRGTESGSGTYGRLVEIQPGNIFHDFKITSEVVWNDEDLDGNGNPQYPIQIDSVAGDANYQFPLLLKSIKLFGAWAFAASEAPASYSEDFFFEIDLVEPAPGPYDATIMRFITDNPDAVRSAYPTTKITTRAETFGMVRWWASASDSGNSTYALARQYNAPASVHEEIELPGVVNYVQGGTRADANYGPGSKTLPATPGVTTFLTSRSTIAGVNTRRSRLGLWEVQVIKLNVGGAEVYEDDQSVSRTLRPGTGSGVIDGYGNPAELTAFIVPRSLGGAGDPPALDTGEIGRFIRISTKNTLSWESDSAWLTSTAPVEIPASSYTSYKFPFSYTANSTGSSRTGRITFTDSVTAATVVFTVIQPSS